MSTTQRMPLVDALKATAALVIVLHHLAAYGPLADAAWDLVPGPAAWFYHYGRITVQVFLVIGGFLAARGLSPQGGALPSAPWGLIGRRYLRLVVPYVVALGVAMLAAPVARHWVVDDAIPGPASLGQFLAHVLLVQDVLDLDALSAGIWYIAIDFQLFVLMALLLWLGRRRGVAPTVVLLATLGSLFVVNRDASWDNWAPYFFGSYGLGAAAWWIAGSRRWRLGLAALVLVGGAALATDFRLRIAVALSVAALLLLARVGGWLQTWPRLPAVAYLGQMSYALFLIHFPVCLLVNAVFVRAGSTEPFAVTLALISALGASLGAGALFSRWVENPVAMASIHALLRRIVATACAALASAWHEVPRLCARVARSLQRP